MTYTKNKDKEFYIKNQSRTNCGSFALNVKEWVDVESIDGCYSESYEGYEYKFISQALLEESVGELLYTFDTLRLLESKEDAIKDNEELIAFRIGDYNEGIPTDYHFRVKRNGKWQEKCGSGPVKDCEEWDDNCPWSEGIVYDSDVIYFANVVE